MMKKVLIPIIASATVGGIIAIIGPYIVVGRLPYIVPEESPPSSVYLKRQYYWKGTNGFSFSWADSPKFPLCSGVTCYSSQTKFWDSCADWACGKNK